MSAIRNLYSNCCSRGYKITKLGKYCKDVPVYIASKSVFKLSSNTKHKLIYQSEMSIKPQGLISTICKMKHKIIDKNSLQAHTAMGRRQHMSEIRNES